MTHRTPLLALLLIVPLFGCDADDHGSEPVPCSPAFAATNGWIATGVLDPRDPLNGTRPARTYDILIDVAPASGDSWSVEVVALDPLTDPVVFEQHGTASCQSRSDDLVAALISRLDGETHSETMQARLRDGHLVGTLTIGGLETPFDAVRQ